MLCQVQVEGQLELVTLLRYLKTLSENILPQVVQAVQDAVALPEWLGKREVARHLPKKKSNKIGEMPGGRVKEEYWLVNNCLVCCLLC